MKEQSQVSKQQILAQCKTTKEQFTDQMHEHLLTVIAVDELRTTKKFLVVLNTSNFTF